MLPRNYRLSAYNDSGASVDVTITVRRWKFDSNGAVVYEASEATVLSATGVADATLAAGNAQDNTTDGWIGLSGVLSLANGTGSQVVTVFLEPSTDGGTTWPGAQDGIPLIGGQPSIDSTVAFIA